MSKTWHDIWSNNPGVSDIVQFTFHPNTFGTSKHPQCMSEGGGVDNHCQIETLMSCFVDRTCMKKGATPCTTQQQEDASNFLLCFDYKHGAKASAFSECAKANNFGHIAANVTECSKSPEGLRLRNYNLDHDKPPSCAKSNECPGWFPYIEVNGTAVTAHPDDIDHFDKKWEKYICGAYRGPNPPAACKKWRATLQS